MDTRAYSNHSFWELNMYSLTWLRYRGWDVPYPPEHTSSSLWKDGTALVCRGRPEHTLVWTHCLSGAALPPPGLIEVLDHMTMLLDGKEKVLKKIDKKSLLDLSNRFYIFFWLHVRTFFVKACYSSNTSYIGLGYILLETFISFSSSCFIL